MSELYHYGVKGQKWGVRRYQNEDGTLTRAGRERYGGRKERPDQGVFKKWTAGSEGGAYAFAKWRERRHEKNLEKAYDITDSKKREKKIRKYQSKLDAQSAANDNLNAYRTHRSAAELIAQNSAMTIGLGHMYRHARARGSSRLSSLLEAGLGMTPIGMAKRMISDKKAYGKFIVFGDPDGEHFMMKI